MKNETLKKPNVFVKKIIFFLYQNQELQVEFFLIYEAVRFHLNPTCQMFFLKMFFMLHKILLMV